VQCKQNNDKKIDQWHSNDGLRSGSGPRPGLVLCGPLDTFVAFYCFYSLKGAARPSW